MGFVGRHRIAQRYDVPTTPITWWVLRRGRRPERSKRVAAEAALVEVSIMGAGIVAPSKWDAPIGMKALVAWGDIEGWVLVRRAVPYRGSDDFVLYGVEYADPQSALGAALYEHFVVEAGRKPVEDPDDDLAEDGDEDGRYAGITEADVLRYEALPAPAVWSAPNVWSEDR